MNITILMPALNEEKSIAQTIDSIPFKELQKLGYEVNIMVIDGRSSDNTVKIAKKMGAEVIISKRGYGYQYRLGFKRVKDDIIITSDSDNSYPLHEIPSLLNIFKRKDLDFISTNRFANLDRNSMRFLNRIGNIVLTFLTNLLFDLNLKDSQSGMWIIKKKALDEINLKSMGMSLSQEIKIEAFKKLRAEEIDSSYKKRIGRVKLQIFKDGYGNLKHLFCKRFFS